MSSEKNQPDCNYDHCQQEHENGNAIDAMHITHPFTMWCIWVSFFDVEIFCKLSPYAHKNHFHSKDIKQMGF
jgi:hypothetical protein